MKARITTAAPLLVGILLVTSMSAAAAEPATAAPAARAVAVVTVTNTSDTGVGSLRDAIGMVNSAVKDTIWFNIPGAGRHVIAPQTDLPAITQPVTIDGYTQPGAARATANVTADLMIVIDAAGLGRGLEFLADDSAVTGLVVRDADLGVGDGIQVEGDRNVVSGNYVGVTANGEQVAGNEGNGVDVRGDGNVVGGTVPADRNVISGNGSDGVLLVGADNIVAGNRIGTDDDGTTDLGNSGSGVEVEGDANQIGGYARGAANLVSGNGGDGVVVGASGTGNEVRGNLIGTDGSGAAPLGNRSGVRVEAAGTVVAGNVIAGNAGSGVDVEADSVTVRNNMIGTNAAGDAALGNGSRGIFVDGSDTVIGGAGLGNVISANGGHGIWIHQGVGDLNVGNVVQGNLIGTDATGSAAMGNGEDGIAVDAADSQIGGRRSGEGNVVSGNGDSGLHISGSGNRIEGNLIGTDAGGSTALPNLDEGIEVYAEANQISQNTVAFNSNDGIQVDSGVGTTVAANSVFGNGDLGIDLGSDGVTTNDAKDVDAGANDLLNYPDITAAATAGGVTGIDWEITDGLPATEFRLEFFANGACNPPGGNGEGQTLLGATTVTTDAFGNAAGHTEPAGKALVGQFITSTATVVIQTSPLVLGSTSEFSACRTVV